MSDIKQLEDIIEEAEKKEDSDLKLSFLSNSVNKILSESKNQEFKNILIRKLLRINSQKPFLKLNEVLKEINSMNDISVKVEIVSDSDINLFNNVIDKIQANRDRLVYLINKIELEHRLLSSTYKHLSDIWSGHFSNGKSADKRKSEAEFILDFLHDDLEDRQNLYSIASNTLRNMGNKMDSLSRKITIILNSQKISGAHYLPPSESSNDFYNKSKKYYDDDDDDEKENIKNYKYRDNIEEAIGWTEIGTEEENINLNNNKKYDDDLENLLEEDDLDRYI